MRLACGNYGNRVSNELLVLLEFSSRPPFRAHMSRLQPHSDLYTIVYVLTPCASRLLRRVDAETVSIEPTVVRRERLVSPDQNRALSALFHYGTNLWDHFNASCLTPEDS
jgi:hypothetical protein